MKADTSRQTFNRLKRLRVQLESDWNEQAQLITYSQRRLAADVFGPHAGPHNVLGFGIEPLNPAITPEGESDFVITPGRYYVDGILCELNSTPIPVTLESTNNKNEVRVGPGQLTASCSRKANTSYSRIGRLTRLLRQLPPGLSTSITSSSS
jgi:Family of unknown function (DUF6519)